MKYVVVETIKISKHRYCVELQDNSPEKWAHDTVTCEEALEIDKTYLGETITSTHTFDSEEKVAIYFDTEE